MILDDIIDRRKETVRKAKSAVPLSSLEERIAHIADCVDFPASLAGTRAGHYRIIAEVKKASPSKGIIRKSFKPVAIAAEYERNGAAAVSVLTEEDFFQGKLEYISDIKQQVNIPVLRKDFIFDPYQVYETKAAGADALLLIAAVLEQNLLMDLLQLVEELKMSALVEVHTENELERVLEAGSPVIGINNRNLMSFVTNIQTTCDLVTHIPKGTPIVSESGIGTLDDIRKLTACGVHAFLIGESLMRHEKPGEKLREFVYGVS